MTQDRLTPDRLRRLAMVRALYVEGMRHARRPQGLSFQAVLSFHDAVEMFLAVTAEALGSQLEREFMKYWPSLDRLLEPAKLGYRVEMERLNKARVSLKHHGLTVATEDLDGFRASTSAFLSDGLRTVFDTDFHHLSMVHLIASGEARDALARAEQALAVTDLDVAAGRCREALEFLLRDERQRSARNRPSFTFAGAHHLGLSDEPFGGGSLGAFGRAWDDVLKTLHELQDATDMTSLGIDYDDLLEFDRLTPRGAWMVNGGLQIVDTATSKELRTAPAMSWCLEFVVDVALRLENRAAIRTKRIEGPADRCGRDT